MIKCYGITNGIYWAAGTRSAHHEGSYRTNLQSRRQTTPTQWGSQVLCCPNSKWTHWTPIALSFCSLSPLGVSWRQRPFPVTPMCICCQSLCPLVRKRQLLICIFGRWAFLWDRSTAVCKQLENCHHKFLLSTLLSPHWERPCHSAGPIWSPANPRIQCGGCQDSWVSYE